MRRLALAGAVVALILAGAYLLFWALPRWNEARRTTAAPQTAPQPPAAERKITATLYYIAEDGMSLVGAQREVPFGEPVAEQARRIVEAQLLPAPPPLARAIPEGTTLRGVYVTERDCDPAAPAECRRDAFVDLSGEARTRHQGGALEELFTIYTVVDAITVNLPSISRVQILVDGKEVDTLAGHIDLRHPLEKNLQWVKTEKDD